MTHQYKSQLLSNLKTYYKDRNWRILTYFNDKREEILFILPTTENIKMAYDQLYTVLASLPEIDSPIERVVISFCHDDGNNYCSKLINPTTQDEINLALIGYTPERKIQLDELLEIQ
jgi:hypothetical protein